jgi:hypothetical protein
MLCSGQLHHLPDSWLDPHQYGPGHDAVADGELGELHAALSASMPKVTENFWLFKILDTAGPEIEDFIRHCAHQLELLLLSYRLNKEIIQ